MNCQDFWESMPELERDPAFARLEHLRECRKCAALIQQQRSLREGLGLLASEMRRVEAPARVEARLLAGFRAQTGLPPMHARRPLLPLFSWAAGAAATVALAFFLVHGRQPQAPRHTAGSALQLAVSGAADYSEAYSDFTADGGFIALPNAQTISPNEEVSVVRVEVPRSAMIAMGYTVSEERAAEPVEAEVVLGTDGLARAVRFLDE